VAIPRRPAPSAVASGRPDRSATGRAWSLNREETQVPPARPR